MDRELRHMTRIYRIFPPLTVRDNVSIIVEPLSVLALATNKNNQGQFSMSIFSFQPLTWPPTCGRKTREDVFWRHKRWRKEQLVLLKLDKLLGSHGLG